MSNYASISLCMLTYNEARVLPSALATAARFVDEIIVVDTGSTDKTKSIARAFGAQIFDFKWCDDFSAARNFGLEKATKGWIFILDPDEVVSPKDAPAIRKLTQAEGIDAWQFPTRNYSDKHHLINFTKNPNDYLEGRGFAGYVESVKTRLFRNFKGLRFIGCVHELVDRSAVELGLTIARSNIPIHHIQEVAANGTQPRRRQLYLRLCEKKAELEPRNPNAAWELGIAYYCAGARNSARDWLCRAVAMNPTVPERLFTLGAILAQYGDKKTSQLLIEKGACLQFPGLTHIDPALRRFPDSL